MEDLLIITGASRGFGKGLCLEIAISGIITENTTLILTSTKLVDLNATRDEILKVNPNLKNKIFVYECDLSTAEDAKTHFEKILDSSIDVDRKYSKVTIILNHGTLGNLSFTHKLSDDVSNIQETININLVGFIVSVSTCLKKLLKIHIDNISFVNISSLAAVQAFESWGLYCSVKAARDIFMQVVSSEAKLLSQDSVNPDLIVKTLNYAPGPLDTDMQTNIRNNTPHEPHREYFGGLKEQGTLVKPRDSAKVLIHILEDNKWENGAHLDYYDLK